ncbi:MAG TPA: hypothetical protein VND22_03420 [Actinomycetota bacterium]|nr:hypothetical protein [Actinomycetota bacterium]
MSDPDSFGPAENPFSVVPSIAEHFAQDSECPYGCPFCTAISMVRKMNPEVSRHLSTAIGELILATRAFVDGLSEESAKPPREESPL